MPNHNRHYDFSLALSGITCSGENQRESQQPYEENHVVKNEGLLPTTAGMNLPAIRVSVLSWMHLECVPPNPNKAVR